MVSDRRYAIRIDSDQHGTLVAGAYHTTCNVSLASTELEVLDSRTDVIARTR